MCQVSYLSCLRVQTKRVPKKQLFHIRIFQSDGTKKISSYAMIIQLHHLEVLSSLEGIPGENFNTFASVQQEINFLFN